MNCTALLSLNLLLAAPLASPAPSAAQAPLPPPPPPVDPAFIEKGPFRGKGWFGLEVGVGGPLDGGENYPSSSRVSAFGWGFHFGYRAQPWLGVGLAFHRRPHDMVQIQFQSGNALYITDSVGHLNSYDLLVLRGFLPTKGRIQPWLDITGGLAVVQPAYTNRAGGVGGQFRTGVGVDFWLQQQISLDLSVHYRVNSVGGGAGHLMRGSAGLTFHW